MEGQQGKIGTIAICTHVFESVDFSVYFNHLYCAAHWGQKYDLRFVGKCGLSAARARNSIIQRAIDFGCTHALFIDGDHMIPVETLEFLLETGDQAMVSGLVCKRGENFQQVAWEVRSVKGHDQYYMVTLPMDGRVYEVNVCAFGCTLINLEKLKKLKKPYFRDTCVPGKDGEEPTNIRSDVNLCLAFREIGENVWIDTRVLIGHLGIAQVVYPQSASLLEKLKSIELETSKLREGQQGVYYWPTDREMR